MKTFLFIEARPVESAGIEYLRASGFSPVLMTSLNRMNQQLYDDLDLSLFDAVHDVDTHDVAAILTRVETLGLDVAGVLGCFDAFVIPAARVAAALGLPHPSLEGLSNAFSKKRMRDVLISRGFEQPAYELLSADDLPARPGIGFPCVIKPLRDAGAYNVSLCRDLRDYAAVVARIQAGHDTPMLGGTHATYLAEEFLEGRFYGAELIHAAGVWRILGINRIFVAPEDSLCMTGISHPSDLSSADADALGAVVLDWVDALGLHGGALNVEFIVTARGPMLVEINLRVAGARAVRQIALTSGVDMIRHLIDFCLGRSGPVVPSRERSHAYVADAFVFSPKAGVIREIAFAPSDPHYVDSGFRHLPLVSTTGSRNFGAVIGYVMAHGASCEEAMKRARSLADSVHVEVE
ncbi:ATP-grasp domain-containing protein [Burkholderia catarinensis]|uniref:ATP-grasp domain-containing protein n=1 Tax=Burkholderia catarinensis TaxID=1108140 RepID=UPI0009227A20|nr:ATP-grasp domain-containing protein [Burkholderia catarinensis]KAG8154033.1 carboxylate--amine ligase [Burkholderia catarinensis]